MDEHNPIAQQLHLLLTAYGYNLYNHANRARADDLLVREQACGHLGEAVNLMTRLATDYTARWIPPSTRDQPFPPAEKLAALRRIEALRESISRLSAHIRGMVVPTQDRVWARFRDENTTLNYLLSCDYNLITGAESILEAVRPLTPESWNEAQEAEVRARLATVDQTSRDREQFLQRVS